MRRSPIRSRPAKRPRPNHFTVRPSQVGWFNPEPAITTIGYICVPVIWLALVLWVIYRKLDVSYALSRHRFRHRHGILYRRMQQMDVIDIDDLVLEQGILEWLLGVGRIKIIGSDKTHAQLTMSGIDRAPDVFDLMEDARREERRRFGLHVEMV